ncbi:MAG: cupin domain-containing protein [Clostridiales bacterium]|nr:cupin domain-containing protein [Clostridiales bacterium]
MDYYTDTSNDFDQGARPFVTNLRQDTINNNYFITTRWTCRNMQLILMSVPINSDVGANVHQASDQFLYIEQGSALVVMGTCMDCLSYQARVTDNYAIIVPAGIWHNIINTGTIDLKMFSIYAPSMYSHGSIYPTKEDADLYQFRQ